MCLSQGFDRVWPGSQLFPTASITISLASTWTESIQYNRWRRIENPNCVYKHQAEWKIRKIEDLLSNECADYGQKPHSIYVEKADILNDGLLSMKPGWESQTCIKLLCKDNAGSVCERSESRVNVWSSWA